MSSDDAGKVALVGRDLVTMEMCEVVAALVAQGVSTQGVDRVYLAVVDGRWSQGGSYWVRLRAPASRGRTAPSPWKLPSVLCAVRAPLWCVCAGVWCGVVTLRGGAVCVCRVLMQDSPLAVDVPGEPEDVGASGRLRGGASSRDVMLWSPDQVVAWGRLCCGLSEEDASVLRNLNGEQLLGYPAYPSSELVEELTLWGMTPAGAHATATAYQTQPWVTPP